MADLLNEKQNILNAYKKVINENSSWDDIWDEQDDSYEDEEDLFADTEDDLLSDLDDVEYEDDEKAERLAKMDAEQDQLEVKVSAASVTDEPKVGQTLVVSGDKAVMVDSGSEDMDSTVEAVLEMLDLVDLNDDEYSKLRSQLEMRSVKKIEL